MWSKGETRSDDASFSLKFLEFSSFKSENFQPLGFLVNIWNVVHLSSLALSIALSIEPEIET